MSDLLKGLTGGGWAGLLAWIAPCAMVFGLFATLFHSHWHSAAIPLLSEFTSLTLSEKATAVVVLSASVGFFLNAVSAPLYRLLEGYSLPSRWRRSWVTRQLERKGTLEASLGNLPQGWEGGLILERLARFPKPDDQVAPTRLGNALRSFETYGSSRFNLDSQTLWTELTSVVPKSLQTELDRSRAIVDFFVALIYLNLFVGILAVCFGICIARDIMLVAYGVVSAASSIVFYNMAISSTTYWSTTVQALVNLGRLPLAEQLGLDIPKSVEDERRMWGYVTSFIYYVDNASAKGLDEFRKAPGTSRTRQADENGRGSSASESDDGDDDD